jgi:hypothetical protein
MVTAELGVPVAVDARPKDAICIGAALMLASPSPSSRPVSAQVGPPAPAAPEVSAPAPSSAPVGPPVSAAGPADTVVSTGPGGPPHPDAAGSAGARKVAVGVLSLVIAVAVGAGAVLLAGEGGAPAAGERATTTVGDPDADPDRERTTTTAELAGSTQALAPLPGDDWSDEARAQFVGDCSTQLASQAGIAGGEPAGVCECIYDDAAATQDFGEFNEMWSSDDFDPDTPIGQWLTGATLDCAMSSVG